MAERGYRDQENFPVNTREPFTALGRFARTVEGTYAVKSAAESLLARSFASPVPPYASRLAALTDYIGVNLKISMPGAFDMAPKVTDAEAGGLESIFSSSLINRVVSLSLIIAAFQESGIEASDSVQAMLSAVANQARAIQVPPAFTSLTESIPVYTPQAIAGVVESVAAESPFYMSAIADFAQDTLKDMLPPAEAETTYNSLLPMVRATAAVVYEIVKYNGPAVDASVGARLMPPDGYPPMRRARRLPRKVDQPEEAGIDY